MLNKFQGQCHIGRFSVSSDKKAISKPWSYYWPISPPAVCPGIAASLVAGVSIVGGATFVDASTDDVSMGVSAVVAVGVADGGRAPVMAAARVGFRAAALGGTVWLGMGGGAVWLGMGGTVESERDEGERKREGANTDLTQSETKNTCNGSMHAA